MAKAQGSATMDAPRKATLDVSMEHPALTPLTRRLAGELWEIVRAKAEAEGLPIEEAWLRGYTDVEGVDEAYIAVLCAAPFERTFAFEDEFNDDFDRWLDSMDAESRETAMALGLDINPDQTLFPVSLFPISRAGL